MTRLYVILLATLTPGEALAQASHAVAEIHAIAPEACARWRAESNTVVVLNAPALILQGLSKAPGVVRFTEPDRGDELTAVALFSPEDAQVRRTIRRLPLAGT